MLNNKTIHQVSDACILLVEISKLIIPRTCFSAHTKNKNIGERWHYAETWGDLPYFSVYCSLFAHFHSAMTVQVGPDRVKNSLAQPVGGVTYGRLEEWRRRWSSPPPHFSFNYKTVCSPLSSLWGTLFPAPLYLSQVSYTNKSLLACHFASHWILSGPRQKNLSFIKS